MVVLLQAQRANLPLCFIQVLSGLRLPPARVKAILFPQSDANVFWRYLCSHVQEQYFLGSLGIPVSQPS